MVILSRSVCSRMDKYNKVHQKNFAVYAFIYFQICVMAHSLGSVLLHDILVDTVSNQSRCSSESDRVSGYVVVLND